MRQELRTEEARKLEACFERLAFRDNLAKLAGLKFLVFIRKHHRHLLAVLAGVVMALAFPNFDLAGAAWVGPALMLASARGVTGWKAWRLGYWAGLTYWLLTLSWLLRIPVTGFPILGWLALSGFVALYPATWVGLLANRIGRGSWLRRCSWSIGGAAIWVALEMIRARLLTGFPWTPLGSSQWQLTPLIQITAVTGVYGVSFLVVWMSLALYSSVVVLLRNPTTRYIWLGEIALPVIVVMTTFNLGMTRIRNASPPDASLQVTFIQPAVPQTMIWDATENTNRFRALLALTQTALTNATDLLLWPEAAVPDLNLEAFEQITNLVHRHQVSTILCSDHAVERDQPTGEEHYEFYNSAYAFAANGTWIDVYHKRQLVIFGEYIPLANALPLVKWLTPITGGYTAGRSVHNFELAGVTYAPLICFEDTFPHHVRDHVTGATDLLVNLTNDGWFGQGAAQWQQAATAAFRAVENGLPLLRCCNNGITCWFDAFGRMREVYRDDSGSVYGPGFANWEISFVSALSRGSATWYHRHGDVFGWGCCGVAVAVVLVRFRPRREQLVSA